MVMWREIWISLITYNVAPIYPIGMGFLPQIMDFYVENYYQIFDTSFLISDAKFAHHIWRHNSIHMEWNKHKLIGN